MRLFAALAVVALACTHLACSEAPETDKTFRFVNRGEVKTLDPNRMSWMQDIRVGYGLWEGLYALDPATLEAVPGAAEKIDLSPDQTTYTFTMRSNGKWSNGEAVTSGDFVFAWRRMLEQPGDYTYLLHYIVGAAEYEAAYRADPASADFAKVGIKAPSPGQLIVTLKHPVGFWPDICAFPPTWPLHQKSMQPFREEAAGGRVSYKGEFTRAGNLVSNGPYRLARWEPKQGIRLEANAYYWNRAAVKMPAVEVLPSEDPQAGFLKYNAGQAHWLAEVLGHVAADMKQQKRDDLHVFPGFGTYFYSINCEDTLSDGRPNPLRDVRVRKALAMALDKKPVVENITRIGEPVALHYIPPGVFAGYNSPAGQPFDLERARALLADAGYPNGQGFPRMSILFDTAGQHGDVAEYVRRNWERNLNIHFELEGQENKTMSERLKFKKYFVSRASWIGDYNDPSTFTDKYRSTSENNDAGWKNPRFDALCDQAAVERDPVRRMQLFAEAEALLLDEVPIIPVYHYVNAYMFRGNVKGIPLHPRNMVMLHAISVE